MNGHSRLFRRKRAENILPLWKNCKGNMRKQYSLELSSAAKRDMRRLPRSVQEEIAFTHLTKIADDPFENSDPLIGTLKGERSYHFGRNPE